MKMGRRLSGSCLAVAGPTAHFDRNESHVIYGTGHKVVCGFLD
jgi:hypothetical protein